MRKIVLLLIPLIVILVLGTVLIAISLNRPAAWQDDLDHYLQHKNEITSWEYKVLATMKANKPWNFNAEMSQVSFGESMYYQTDYAYGEQLSSYDTLSVLPREPRNGHRMALPFPPEEVWCVWLGREDQLRNDRPANESVALVLIALHQDLYNADYIIHEFVDGSQAEATNEIVSMMDCEFPEVIGSELGKR